MTSPGVPQYGAGPMSHSESLRNAREYYDDFAQRYDDRRGGRDPGGYHDLIDDLEVEFVARFARGLDLLEVGCGTGLLLSRFAEVCRTARGVDLSPGMLARAAERGLDVTEGSATDLPFASESFDVACSFKVLAHIEDIQSALREMFRVVRPGGVVIAEFYNPISIRALAKRAAGAQPVSDQRHEGHVHTRFDAPWAIRRLLPGDFPLVASRGIRIVTPAAKALAVPVVGGALKWLERGLCDSPLRVFGGFYVAAFLKR
jgi:ubiquinone/menaquinone biosynthesis C-methylase UbiE